MSVEPRLLRLAPITLPSPGGQRDDDDVLAVRSLAQSAADLVAVQAGHADIEKYDLGTVPLCRRERFGPVVRDESQMTVRFQQPRERFRAAGIVVDDEDPA